MGRLENISSDRRLLTHCAMRLDILLFLDYEVDEELPWHSTISRTRQLYPATLFEHLFDRVFHLCVVQGLVAGDTPAIDSVPVKANASLGSPCEKQAVAPPLLTVAGQLAQTPALPILEQRGITGWIPASKRYEPSIACFTYLPEENAYQCRAGKLLPFRNYGSTPDGGWQRNYRTDYKDCKRCPLAQRQLHAGRATPGPGSGNIVDRAGTCAACAKARSSPHYGLRRLGTKDQAAAHKTMLLAAPAYNLQKLLNHRMKQPRSMALVIQPEHLLATNNLFWRA